ncbi:EAL domain-containing protein [Halobacillus halophilus]|uniref:Diguanylate phosphodiesterase domain protein n=1 Tax=Halobacillus halophilus (strain ATCC 35676 / DSM 2266 / JCM 20832 / KCTC 3685 / LMG 17431 / NBRC 102448 / NCIMB 2269) TaxID=866895 RepID=I0JPV6_HALH3|nr:EAL domain-containing protein [Halobacillus halophilus]ASF40203.1 EAL domain-containing protein [Halobacillus halophilus]CCG46176.1 diguanylate phosphodiesterase domain protein [Halobacillus halophilus DSM 2266]
MSKDCQFCGTNFLIPESGSIVLNQKKSIKPLQLFVSHEDEETIIYRYKSKKELKTSLGVLLSSATTATSKDWLHILNLDSTQYLPISIQHLYERLDKPELGEIIQHGTFTSHLQPIVDMKNDEIYGYESLLRTEGENINPAELFSHAQRSGLQSMLDQKARRTAVKAKSDFLQKGQKIFINFLPSTIYVPEFCLQHTFQIVKEFNIDPADLVFEVVETEKITNVKHLKSILDTYKTSGMKVALDDVGAGYSTLEMLSLLKPDYLKIDRSYIQNCYEDLTSQDFLFQVMRRASNLGIKVLAEGIETRNEWDWLRELGVDYGQGYFIGKPAPLPKETINLLP